MAGEGARHTPGTVGKRAERIILEYCLVIVVINILLKSSVICFTSTEVLFGICNTFCNFELDRGPKYCSF